MRENLDWISAGIQNGGKTRTGLRPGLGMEENPNWISAGIWTKGKPGLDFSWDMEWREARTGF